MITKELKKLVREEADKLKATATEKELARLDFDSFWAEHPKFCVYGQMTGFCRSQRGVTLLKKCAVSFSGSVDEEEWQIKPPVNGFKQATEGPDIKVFSPIEVYICQPEAKNENLLAYLKGEKKRLVL